MGPSPCQAVLACPMHIHEAEATLKCQLGISCICLQLCATRPSSITPIAFLSVEHPTASSKHCLQPQDRLWHLRSQAVGLCLNHADTTICDQDSIMSERPLGLEGLHAIDHMRISDVDLPANHEINIIRLGRMCWWPYPMHKTDLCMWQLLLILVHRPYQ